MRNTLITDFSSAASKWPERIAVVDCEQSMTYRQLDHDSNVLAHIIYQASKGDNAFVALMLPRRVSFLVSSLAAQKAGCAYVNISSTYPPERINYILHDSRPVMFITTNEYYNQKKQQGRIELQDTDLLLIDQTDLTSVETKAIDMSDPDKRAMMLYTSGTTGNPKGVLHSGRSLYHSCTATHQLKPGTDAPWLITAVMPDFSFIAYLDDLYGPLCFGGIVHVIDDSVRTNMNLLHQYLLDHGIYQMFLPSQFGVAMINDYDLGLKRILLGGDKVTGLNPHKIEKGLKVYNGYGMSEIKAIRPHLISPEEKVYLWVALSMELQSI